MPLWTIRIRPEGYPNPVLREKMRRIASLNHSIVLRRFRFSLVLFSLRHAARPQPKRLEWPHIEQDKPLELVLTGGRNAIPEDRET